MTCEKRNQQPETLYEHLSMDPMRLFGHHSHIWLVSMVHVHKEAVRIGGRDYAEKGEITAFAEPGDRHIRNLTHWRFAIPEDAAGWWESSTESGYSILEFLAQLFVFACVVLFVVLIFAIINQPVQNDGNCPPAPATGRLLCYSGGTLVYQTPTYRNGGHLCTPSGVEVSISSSRQTDSFCIEESTQPSPWNPPPPGKR